MLLALNIFWNYVVAVKRKNRHFVRLIAKLNIFRSFKIFRFHFWKLVELILLLSKFDPFVTVFFSRIFSVYVGIFWACDSICVL